MESKTITCAGFFFVLSFLALTSLNSVDCELVGANSTGRICTRNSVESFNCPEHGQPSDWTFCCGSDDDVASGQYCCRDESADVDIAESHHARHARSVSRASARKKPSAVQKKTKEALDSLKRYVAKVDIASIIKLNDVSKFWGKVKQTIMEFLKKTNAELAKRIEQPMNKITEILRKANLKLASNPLNARKVLSDLKTRFKRFATVLENGVDSAASAVEIAMEEFLGFMENVSSEVAQQIKGPVKEIVDTMKRAEIEDEEITLTSSGITISVPISLRTMAPMLFVILTLHHKLFF